MKEEHPIDDLFARALGSAEAGPPDSVWAGIVRERNWAHLLLLRLKRQWGWAALLLLLLAGGGLVAVRSMQSPATDSLVANTLAGPATAAVPMEPPQTLAGPDPDPVPAPDETTAPLATDGVGTSNGLSAPVPDGVHGDTRADLPTGNAATATGRAAHPPSTPGLVAAQARTDLNNSQRPASLPGQLPPAAHLGPTRPDRTAAQEGPWTTAQTDPDRPAGDDPGPGREKGPFTLELLDPLPFRMAPRTFIPMDRPVLLHDPIIRRHAWWVAATAGFHRETRTWHGQDNPLSQALQATETPHHTTGFGVLAGVDRRDGWNLAAGLEYNASRYEFNHLARTSTLIDSLVTYVVTFNSSVLDSHTDTVTTYEETTRSAAAVNRYTSWRVPLELGWHRGRGRWHGGVRAGLSLELNTMRSGITLVDGAHGTQVVDVGGTEKRKSVQLAGGIALDLGYAINERLGLWASPGYTTGLFSLSPRDGSPYAASERLGVRFRLAYILTPR